MVKGNALGLRPFRQCMCDELRVVVQSNREQCIAHLHQLVESQDDARRRQAGVHLYAQGYSVELIDDVEGPEAPTRPQSIGIEVAARAMVGLTCRVHGLFDARRQPLLSPRKKVFANKQ